MVERAIDKCEIDKKIKPLLALWDTISKVGVKLPVMLEAKGFADAMVTMNADGDVNVVINTPSLSDQQLAIVEDVVLNETEATIDKITIYPVIVSD